MVRLTADLIVKAPYGINACKELELDLRANKIPMIENLGATQDQYDTIDLSENEIRKLDGFPVLRRLQCLLLNHNRINKIATGLGTTLPALEMLVLTHNVISNLQELEPLAELPNLRKLCLLLNPVVHHEHYRAFVIFKIPQLKALDFQRIRPKERAAAAKLFSGKAGEKLQNEIRKTNTYEPEEAAPGTSATPKTSARSSGGPTPEQVTAIRAAIQNAKTLQEVYRLESALNSGQIPQDMLTSLGVGGGAGAAPGNGGGAGAVEETEDMEE